jgi:ribose transport system substrate-binding protein
LQEEIMKALVIAAGILAGLGSQAPALAQSKPTVVIIVKETASPYWQAVLAGARKAGQELGITLSELGTQTGTDVNAQIGLLRNAVASNPSAILIAPIQFAALQKPIEEAARKTKIVSLGSTADAGSAISFVGTDNMKAGAIAADGLAAAITRTYGDTEGNVAIITSRPGIRPLDQRTKGFKEVVAAKYRALNIVADKVADGEPATVRKIVKDIVTGTSDLRGILVADRIMTQVVWQGVLDAKPSDKINIVGFGASAEVVKLMQADAIAGLVVEDPFRIGYEGVRSALAASRAEAVPATVDTGATLITKATMSSPRSQELLRSNMH